MQDFTSPCSHPSENQNANHTSSSYTLSATSMSRSLFLKTLTPPSTILCPGLLIPMMGLMIPTIHTQRSPLIQNQIHPEDTSPPHLLDKLHNPSVSMHNEMGYIGELCTASEAGFPVPTSVLNFSQTCDVAQEWWPESQRTTQAMLSSQLSVIRIYAISCSPLEFA